MLTLEERAIVFATKKHEGQVRKYTKMPYIVHPRAVANIVRTVHHDEEMLAAAWLHDVVEDTGTTLDEIECEFGKDVAELIEMLTDVSKPSDGNRKIRKAMDLGHTAMACPAAMTIKLADLIDNSEDILVNDPDFARVYIREKERLLKVLVEGDNTLWERANVICGDAEQRFQEMDEIKRALEAKNNPCESQKIMG